MSLHDAGREFVERALNDHNPPSGPAWLALDVAGDTRWAEAGWLTGDGIVYNELRPRPGLPWDDPNRDIVADVRAMIERFGVAQFEDAADELSRLGQEMPADRLPGQTPGQASTGNIVDDIDAAVEGRCACGCGAAITDRSASMWFSSQDCQHTYLSARAHDAQDVYDRPDADDFTIGEPGAVGRYRVRPGSEEAVREILAAFDRAVVAAGLTRREQPPSITCPTCRRRSHHPRDVAERYCPNCRAFHDDMSVFAEPDVPSLWWETSPGTVAALGYRRRCAPCSRHVSPTVHLRDAADLEIRDFGRMEPVRSWLTASAVEAHSCPACRFRWVGDPYEPGLEIIGEDYVFTLGRHGWRATQRISRHVLHEAPNIRVFADRLWDKLQAAVGHRVGP